MRKLKGEIRFLSSATCTFSGKPVVVRVHVVGRGGSDSPETWYIEYEGKVYSPYAQKKRDINLGLTTFLKLMYGDNKLKDLVYQDNPFLKLISKDE